MATVKLDNIFKSYGETEVVKGLSLRINDGEFIVLVGPSGCGKTTTLRMIAGLEEITEGNMYIGQNRINDVAPKDRNIAMVFQNYALYAHMTVFNNIAFGLKLRKVSKSKIRERVTHAASIVGMSEYLARKPKELSGGQRQRVALARAIVRNPGVYLFDEPLSNLDAKLRVQMRMEIARLQRKLKTTTVYVTHDQVEAMTMADRIAVLNNGELQQFGKPMQLYHQPANLFVAGFIGSPSMNFIEGKVNDDSIFTDKGDSLKATIPDSVPNKNITLGIRPEDIYLDKNGVNNIEIEGEVVTVELMGNESIIYFTSANAEMIARSNSMVDISYGKATKFYIDESKIHFFDTQTGIRIKE